MREPTAAERDQCARIAEKLPRAAAADPELVVFGATTHQYRLGPPIAVARVEEFEARYGIQLPSQYAAFLTLVGQGGAGPHHGLLWLDAIPREGLCHNDWFCDNDCMTVDLSPTLRQRGCRDVVVRARRLKRLVELDAPQLIVDNEMVLVQRAVDRLFDDGQSHPVSGPSDPLVVRICELAVDDDSHRHLRRECPWVPGEVPYWNPDDLPDEGVELCYDGLLPVCDAGSCDVVALVLDGPHRGRVAQVNLDPVGLPFFIDEPNFLDYYERWLDEIVAGRHLGGDDLEDFCLLRRDETGKINDDP